MALRPSTNYLPCPGALIPQSVITENTCDNIFISYNAVAYLYFSEQPHVFYHIVLTVADIMLRFFNNVIMCLMCAIVLEASCLLSSEKN